MHRLEVRDVSFAYPGHSEVLSGFDMTVAAGEVHCVEGPSGAGKTTVLRLIAGLERLQRGTIRVDGQEIASAKRHVRPERRSVAIVFQDLALFPNRTVLGNVTFGMHHLRRATRREAAMDLLRQVQMDHLADRMPHSLSGGQQQRVAIARAFATKPSVMLLDEPFCSLDPCLRCELREEMLGLLRRAGVATVLVTHAPEEVEKFADRVTCCREINATVTVDGT
ncbi:MAG: ATP-binding cassette domain-containing protein [Planctomycetota bacterium]